MKLLPKWVEMLAQEKVPLPTKGVNKVRLSLEEAAGLGPEGLKAHKAAIKKAQNQRYRQRTAVSRAIRVAVHATLARTTKLNVRAVKTALWRHHGAKTAQCAKIERLECKLDQARDIRDRALQDARDATRMAEKAVTKANAYRLEFQRVTGP